MLFMYAVMNIATIATVATLCVLIYRSLSSEG
jgi:hypothetical protein